MTVVSSDLDHLLLDVNASNPGGEYIRFQPEFDDLKSLREKMVSYLSDFDNGDPVKSSCIDFQEAAFDLLKGKTKDLQIAIWLTESLLLHEHFSGLEKATLFLLRFVKKFWNNMHPIEPEGEYSGRLAAFDWLDKTMVREIELLKFIGPPVSRGISFNKFFVENLKKKERKWTGIEVRRISASDRIIYEQFIKEKNDLDVAISQMTSEYLNSLNLNIKASIKNFEETRKTIEENIGEQTDLFKQIIERLVSVNKIILRFEGDKNKSEEHASEIKKSETLEHPKYIKNIDQVDVKENPVKVDFAKVKTWVGSIEERSELYSLLYILIEQLKLLDPNSPNIQLGNKMLLIKDMNFIDIMEELVDDRQMIDFVSRFFGVKE